MEWTKWLMVNSHYSPSKKIREEMDAERERLKLDKWKGRRVLYSLVGNEAFAHKPCSRNPLPIRNMTNE